MMMKKFLPKKTDGNYRVRPLRTVIICILIAVMLVSVSVGMGYSKYTSVTKPFEMTYQVKDYVLPSDRYVFMQKVDNPASSYNFYSSDRIVRVAYSKESTDETLNNAEYLVADFNPGENTIDYTAHSNQIRLRYEIGLNVVNHDNPLLMPALKCSINNDPRGIVVYLKVGTDADPASIYDGDSSLSVRYAYPDSNISIIKSRITDYGQIAVSSFGQLYRYDEENNLLKSRFELNYDKLGWSEYADTDWYDDDPTDPEFWISTPAELAGLAQIVNDGTEDFEGKTIHLSRNINLADADGYLRRWTPIGTVDHPFKGSFDGGSFTVSGLNVADFGASGDDAAAGLFGYISGDGSAEIKDLTISTAYISTYLYVDPSANSPVSSGAAGALAGWVTGGYQISGVSIKNANLCGIANTAGYLLGRCDAGTTFVNCSADSDCTDSAGGFSAANAVVDGLVGFQSEY